MICEILAGVLALCRFRNERFSAPSAYRGAQEWNNVHVPLGPWRPYSHVQLPERVVWWHVLPVEDRNVSWNVPHAAESIYHIRRTVEWRRCEVLLRRRGQVRVCSEKPHPRRYADIVRPHVSIWHY